jgi:potassium-transporting ATPase potassium-binding subunit
VNFPSLVQYTAFLVCITLLVTPLGGYMARVFQGERTLPDRLLRPIETCIYRVLGVDPGHDMAASEYTVAFLLFSLAGTLLLYGLLRLQPLLPWHDAAFLQTPMTQDLAFNTAISFSTTTTWQAYSGETTMSYFSQTVGLAAQNFLAGAAGLAVGIGFLRGLVRTKSAGIGNFWVDVVRSILWILLPISLVGALLLVWQGVPANFEPYTRVITLEGRPQSIAQGPVAPLEIIKNLGTNGGGFFNANGAHPFENPTPLTNFLEMLAIAALPAALPYTFGRMLGRPRQGWVLFGVMAFLFSAGLALSHIAEQGGNPRIARAGRVESSATGNQPGGNMEGKEVRFGIGGSVLAAITTSNGATGSTNSMHDSYTPAGGLVPLVNMLLGELVFGGLGTGLYSILITAFIGLFAAGLMVGKTPEFAGKVIGSGEIKLIMLYSLAAPAFVLIPTAAAVTTPAGLAGLTTNFGPHGFSEILYAFTSSFANNGQAFAGLSANSPFYNVATALAMFAGRFGLAIPALALAGRFARQGRRPMTAGTLPTDSLTFAVVLIGTALIVGALSYFPALALGPTVEHLLMRSGTLF